MGKVKGHYVYPGKPCHFMAEGEGCTIYEDRPKLCRMFECAWLTDPSIPEKLRPDKSNLIIMPSEVLIAVPLHNKEVSEEHQKMYEEWLKNKTTKQDTILP